MRVTCQATYLPPPPCMSCHPFCGKPRCDSLYKFCQAWHVIAYTSARPKTRPKISYHPEILRIYSGLPCRSGPAPQIQQSVDQAWHWILQVSYTDRLMISLFREPGIGHVIAYTNPTTWLGAAGDSLYKVRFGPKRDSLYNGGGGVGTAARQK